MSDRLSRFIPEPDVRERHAVRVRAPADVVHRVACSFDMQSVAPIRWTFRLRERLLGARQRPRTARALVDEMRSLGWGCLADEPGLYIGGAACRPWQADVIFHAISPASFASEAAPDHVKIAWSIETRALGDEACELSSETRVVATDAVARVRFLRYWRWARFGIIGIRLVLLPAIRRQAEREWRERRGAAGESPHERR